MLKSNCQDCFECQMCSKNRCRLCQKVNREKVRSELGPFITHGQYLEWKRKRIASGNCSSREAPCQGI